MSKQRLDRSSARATTRVNQHSEALPIDIGPHDQSRVALANVDRRHTIKKRRDLPNLECVC
jgi:hypothetical protein